MIHSQRGKRGFITAIILIVTALIVLGFFGFNLKSIVNSPTVTANLSYVWGLLVHAWNIFIVTPAVWLWDKVQGVLFKVTS